MRTYYESDNGKTFESEEEAREEDKKYLATQKKEEAAKAERKEASQKVIDAYKSAAKAKRDAEKEMQKFIDEYGSFHTTLRGDDCKDFFDSPIDLFFDHLWF